MSGPTALLLALLALAAATATWPVGGYRRPRADRARGGAVGAGVPRPGGVRLGLWLGVRLGGVRLGVRPPGGVRAPSESTPLGGRGRSPVSHRNLIVGLGVLCPMAAAPVLGWAATAAALMVSATVARLLIRYRAESQAGRDLAALTRMLRAAMSELAAGGSPAAAAAQAHDGAPGYLRALMAGLAEGVQLPEATGRPRQGRRLPSAGAAAPGRDRRRYRRALGAAWAVASRHGVPLESLLGALLADVEARIVGRDLRAAQSAGSAISGYVLAALPVAALAMGAGMGADPVGVLFLGEAGTTGGVLLTIGVALCCAGLIWTSRITRGPAHG